MFTDTICSNAYNDISIFHNFLLSTFVSMSFMKHLPCFLIKENKTIQRKFNQYTNWNIFMICAHYIMYHYYDIHSSYLSKFIAINSLQIFLLYHGFVIYDSRILFDILDNSKPFLLNIGRNHNIMIRIEYIIINFFIHILPIISYWKYLFEPLPCYCMMNMSVYTILFKFMWALNIFGNFEVISIYLPSLKICSIKLFNMIVIFDYSVSILLKKYTDLYIKNTI